MGGLGVFKPQIHLNYLIKCLDAIYKALPELELVRSRKDAEARSDRSVLFTIFFVKVEL